MKKRKFISITILTVALISFVGGFCAPFFAQASMASKMHMIGDRNMGGTDHMEMLRGMGMGSTMMPCCDTQQKELVSDIVLPSSIKEKVQFFASDAAAYQALSEKTAQSNIDSLSLTSPPGGGLTATTIKKE